MTKKLKVYLLIILAAVCVSCAFVGCKVGRPGREEVLAGYKAHVTYYSNGGFFDDSTSITVRDVYFKNDPNMEGYNPNGIPFFDVGESGDIKVARDGYDLVGWFMPEVYDDGEHAGQIMYTYTYTTDDGEMTVPAYPLLNENGAQVTDIETDRPVFKIDGSNEQISESAVRIVPSDTSVTSDRLVADDENLTVCAKWTPSLKVIYKLVCEEGKTYTDSSGKEYTNGAELRSDDFGKGDVYSPSSMSPIGLSGATFVRSYLDEELKTVVGPITRPEADENDEVTDPVVYSHYIDGEGWNIVENSTHALSMFNGLSSSTNKYYVIEDIDCGTRNFSLNNANITVNATVVGNGHTLSNLNFSLSGTAGQGMVFSIFGNIGDRFSLTSLKLKNVTITLRARANTTLYAVSSGVNANAQISGLEIDGIKATVSLPLSDGCYVTNAQNGNRDKWLFGGDSVSDAAFLESHTGIKITGENTLTIQD